MNKEIIEQAQELVFENARRIAELIFQPQGLRFFVYKKDDGTMGESSLLTVSTRLNPANWEKGEWAIVFDCTQDLDDVADGEEIEAIEEWLITTSVYDDAFENKITFPAGEDEE